MAQNKRRLMTYEELMKDHPDFIFGDASRVFQEETPEMTKQARLRKKARLGQLVRFMQDHGLTRRIICASAPDIPDDLVVYYRDLMPEALEFDRQAVSKWQKRFERDMHADPSDVRILEKSLAEIRAKVGDGETAKVAAPKKGSHGRSSTTKGSAKDVAATSELSEFVKYDDASWHYEGKFPEGLPNEAGATHSGMFLAWALLCGLAADDHIRAFAEAVSQLKSRTITPGAYFIKTCDGKFTSEELSEEGNAFARAYFDLQAGEYLRDYERLLTDGLPSTYHVPDTWDSFDKLKTTLDQRFSEWKNAGRQRKN